MFFISKYMVYFPIQNKQSQNHSVRNKSPFVEALRM